MLEVSELPISNLTALLPVIFSDPSDVSKDLLNSKAVVVSASAPQAIVEAFVEAFGNCDAHAREIPFVLVADCCGTNDRKKQLVLDVLDEHVPTMISGRLGDIYSTAQRVIEKSEFVVFGKRVAFLEMGKMCNGDTWLPLFHQPIHTQFLKDEITMNHAFNHKKLRVNFNVENSNFNCFLPSHAQIQRRWTLLATSATSAMKRSPSSPKWWWTARRTAPRTSLT